jgi:hypothetical protein
MHLIGITGKARAGKDTVAKYLVRNYGFVSSSFALPLKRAAKEMFGLSDDEAFGDELKEVPIPFWWGLSPRAMFQKLGTEGGRILFGDDIWLKRWERFYLQYRDSAHVVVSDVRFDNEADHHPPPRRHDPPRARRQRARGRARSETPRRTPRSSACASEAGRPQGLERRLVRPAVFGKVDQADGVGRECAPPCAQELGARMSVEKHPDILDQAAGPDRARHRAGDRGAARGATQPEYDPSGSTARTASTRSAASEIPAAAPWPPVASAVWTARRCVRRRRASYRR